MKIDVCRRGGRIVCLILIAVALCATAACAQGGAAATTAVTTTTAATTATTAAATTSEAAVTTTTDEVVTVTTTTDEVGATTVTTAATATTTEPTSAAVTTSDVAGTTTATTTAPATTTVGTVTTAKDEVVTGSPADMLTRLTDAIKAAGVQMPMSTPPADVTADVSQNTLGLSETDFGEYVVSASNSTAAIGTFAHQMAVIQATDADAAVKVRDLISGDGGYDAGKWVCVRPEKCAAAQLGAYVLLVAANADVADAAVAAFEAEAAAMPDAGPVDTVVFAEAET